MLDFDLGWIGDGLGFAYLFDRTSGLKRRANRRLLGGVLLRFVPWLHQCQIGRRLLLRDGSGGQDFDPPWKVVSALIEHRT